MDVSKITNSSPTFQKQLSLVPSIYIDLDDVLAETLIRFTELVREMYGRKVAFSEIHAFDLSESFRLTKEQHSEFMHAAHLPAVLGTVSASKLGINTLKIWAAAGCHITVVTGRPISTYFTTREWLGKHQVPYSSLRFVRKYGKNDLGPAERQPLDIRTLRKSNFIFAVEDSLKMAIYLVTSLKLPVLMLDKPWNQGPSEIEESEFFHRCSSWEDVRIKGSKLIQRSRRGEGIL